MKQEAILVHGWNPRYYNNQLDASPQEDIAWTDRPELIKLLRQRYHVCYYNLPGFCGVNEPRESRFSVGDFAKSFFEWKSKYHEGAKLLIGYSFGGAILLEYRAKYRDTIPTVLVSPAILRSGPEMSKLPQLLKSIAPGFLVDSFRHLYQFCVNKYYRLGTPFLRRTYNLIVRDNLTHLLRKVDVENLLLIYGQNDLDTPWNLVQDTVKACGIKYCLISGGGHGIGQTHPKEIIKAIDSLVKRQ